MLDWLTWKDIAQLTGAGFLVIVLLYMIFKFINDMVAQRKNGNGNGMHSIIKEVKQALRSDFDELRKNHDDMSKKLDTLATKQDLKSVHKEFHSRVNHHEYLFHRKPQGGNHEE